MPPGASCSKSWLIDRPCSERPEMESDDPGRGIARLGAPPGPPRDSLSSIDSSAWKRNESSSTSSSWNSFSHESATLCTSWKSNTP
eukprot:CAMPEP_0180284790 /NCGR_PEP_ID=MMETSP0988-20121125/11460_1 /TAXON_ID=697907 /ORGANISM="non described non described, Strain CCMP2293" /LENGTH=85 /DNA_ID=CAMNT_0022257939 /DNA_START=275 /DNA_END=529 /DNA_ORIENTATION=-